MVYKLLNVKLEEKVVSHSIGRDLYFFRRLLINNMNLLPEISVCCFSRIFAQPSSLSFSI